VDVGGQTDWGKIALGSLGKITWIQKTPLEHGNRLHNKGKEKNGKDWEEKSLATSVNGNQNPSGNLGRWGQGGGKKGWCEEGEGKKRDRPGSGKLANRGGITIFKETTQRQQS